MIQYLKTGKRLPSKVMMISFDDTHEEDFSIAKPILDHYGFKAIFFIMTVCIDKPHYLTSDQIKELSDEGHIIANHTWDHPTITMLTGNEWEQQIDKPRLRLEKITGKPVNFFAYPYGVWNDQAIEELKKRNITGAFQLSGKMNQNEPLFTIRRMMVSGQWSPEKVEDRMEQTFRVKFDHLQSAF